MVISALFEADLAHVPIPHIRPDRPVLPRALRSTAARGSHPLDTALVALSDGCGGAS